MNHGSPHKRGVADATPLLCGEYQHATTSEPRVAEDVIMVNPSEQEDAPVAIREGDLSHGGASAEIEFLSPRTEASPVSRPASPEWGVNLFNDNPDHVAYRSTARALGQILQKDPGFQSVFAKPLYNKELQHASCREQRKGVVKEHDEEEDQRW